ncbi:hypothetical protein [Aliarcobacter butzleri]|nr:hypothetical protein [Aliarcobacter butzleri]MCT7647671.1 hypothetical protein [Aliarcobacter butzleri]
MNNKNNEIEIKINVLKECNTYEYVYFQDDWNTARKEENND